MSRAKLLGYLFSLISALGYGGVSVIAKKGLLSYGSPLAAASVSMFAGTLLMATFSFRHVEVHPTGGKRGILLFLLSGVMAGLGQLAMYLALGQAPVVVVSPVTSASPLLTILLVYFFLRGLERVGPRVALASGLVVAGVILVSLGGR